MQAVPLPAGKIFDGVDLAPMLFGDAAMPARWLWHRLAVGEHCHSAAPPSPFSHVTNVH